MDAEQELALLRRCQAFARDGGTQLAECTDSVDVARYTDPARYAQEQKRIFRTQPLALVATSELARPDDFVTVDSPLGSVLITHSEAGEILAFHNVCRHRGTRLVDDAKGCAQRFACPYHAWTYSNGGKLIGVPQQDRLFPDLQRAEHGLVPLACTTRYGLVWVAGQALDFDDAFAAVHADLQALGLDRLKVFASETQVWNANWKIIAEGGLEAYHFRHAHRATIAPYFFDNLALYDAFGKHLRMVLPRRSLAELAEPPPPGSLRAHSHLTYALFPSSTLLVQADHVVWIRAHPRAADRTDIRLTTLVPAVGEHASKPAAHWQMNHQITTATLAEDFTLAQSIQSGLASGANERLLFGRSEGALSLFKHIVDESL